MSYSFATTPPPGLSMPLSLSASMDTLKSQYERMCEAETQRHVFVDHLIAQVTSLMQEKEDALRRLQRVEVGCDHYQKRLDEAQKSAENMQKAINCDRFVLVLIDGDVTLFNDDYVSAGTSGGERAASDLNNAIFEHLKSTNDFQHDFKIHIRIYVNLHGLAKTLHEAGIVTSRATFHQFVQGFNKIHELSEIVDAGDLKEAADSKIKATFNLYRRNLHCKHIMLAGSGDNSYAGFLSQFATTTTSSNNLTLIKGYEFARDLAPLADKIGSVSFPHLFRATKVWKQSSPTFNHAKTTNGNGIHGTAWTTVSSKPSASPPSSTAENGLTGSMGALSVKPITSTTSTSSRMMWVNADGHRVDKPIQNLDRELATRLKKMKLCNRHHLRGDCSSFSCAHSHEGKLNEEEKRALRFVARSRPCMTGGIHCEDPDCVDGHRCPFADSCRNEKCWFNEEMHRTTFEGAREVLPNKYITIN